MLDAAELPCEPDRLGMSANGLPTLMEGLLAILGAETWERAREVVVDYPELLGTEARAEIESYAARPRNDEDPQMREMLADVLDFLAECHDTGIEVLRATVADDADGPPRVPVELVGDLEAAVAALERHLASGSPRDLDQACGAWRRICRAPAFAAADVRLRTASLGHAGGALLRRYLAREKRNELREALTLLEQAREQGPGHMQRSVLLGDLGVAYRELYRIEHDPADLDLAIDAYD